MTARITITAKRAGQLVTVRTPLSELVAAAPDAEITVERAQVVSQALKYQLTEISVGLLEPSPEKRPVPQAESLSARLHRLAREVEQFERTGHSLLSTADKVLASAEDHSDVAVLERDYAAIHMARDIRALFANSRAPSGGATLRVLRGEKS